MFEVNFARTLIHSKEALFSISKSGCYNCHRDHAHARENRCSTIESERHYLWVTEKKGVRGCCGAFRVVSKARFPWIFLVNIDGEELWWATKSVGLSVQNTCWICTNSVSLQIIVSGLPLTSRVCCSSVGTSEGGEVGSDSGKIGSSLEINVWTDWDCCNCLISHNWCGWLWENCAPSLIVTCASNICTNVRNGSSCIWGSL